MIFSDDYNRVTQNFFPMFPLDSAMEMSIDGHYSSEDNVSVSSDYYFADMLSRSVSPVQTIQGFGQEQQGLADTSLWRDIFGCYLSESRIEEMRVKSSAHAANVIGRLGRKGGPL